MASNNKNINKNTLAARTRAYEQSVAGKGRVRGVSTTAFHKPGSNKK